jgi:hypothetical protein
MHVDDKILCFCFFSALVIGPDIGQIGDHATRIKNFSAGGVLAGPVY